ncbi:MAG: MFS transporter [Proteobacteria bacterium]|nr:MFS transporter [Pseudomonadota bacterium]
MIAAIERLTGLEWKNQGTVFLVGLGHGGIHWTAATLYLLLPFITRDLGLSYTEAGMLVAVFHISAFVANFASGLIVDVTGRRVVFQVLSLAVGAAALLASGYAQGIWWLVPMVVLIGATNNLWHPPAISFLSQHYPRQRGYTLSIHALGANTGDAVAPLAAGALLVWLSWRQTASLNALPVFLVAGLIWFVLLKRDTPAKPAAGAEKTEHGMGLAEYFDGLKALVKDRAVLHLSLMAGFRTMAQMGLLIFLPLYLADVMGMGPFMMGVTMMALQVGGMCATPVAGAWSDRIGRRPVVLGGLSITTVLIVVLTVVQNEIVFVGGVAVMGFVMYAARPVIHSWMMDLAPPEVAASATSVMFGVQALFTTVMLMVSGAIADAWGLGVVFYLLAASMLAANVLVYLLPNQLPGESGINHKNNRE